MSEAGHQPAASSCAQAAGPQVCLVLVCFRGVRRAARARRRLAEQITSAGDSVLDEVVLEISHRRKTRVYDPHRVIAGTATSALTWGVFGLLTGGVASGGLWAIIGAGCGGLFAYYYEHLLTKDELKRIGKRLPADSSAVAAFVQAQDARRVLTSAAKSEPAEASVAAIGCDLSARVVAGVGMPLDSSSAPPGGGPVPAHKGSVLSMLLMRYRGTETARRELGRHRATQPGDGQALQPELVFEAPDHGRFRVSDPAQGAWAFAKSDVVSWGLFGLVYGLIVGLVSNHGIVHAVTVTAVAGITCAVFGLAAGALYGLWAGRAVSARRLHGVRPLLAPGTSTILAWSEDTTQKTVDDWAVPGTERLIVRFNPVGDGALLEV